MAAPPAKGTPPEKGTPKVVVVMPAYNAGRTLRMTYEELPKDTVNLVILVDDGSTDATLEVARDLGSRSSSMTRTPARRNQKTCYTEALKAGADIVVMVLRLPVRSPWCPRSSPPRAG